MIEYLRQKTTRILDYIYPATCHLCSLPLTHGKHLCSSCSDSLEYLNPPFCDRCGEAYDGSIDSIFTCPNCHDLKLDFEFAKAALHSKGGARELVHDFKYRQLIYLANELGRLLLRPLTDPRFKPYLDSAVLVPVPLHWSRLRKRKFNQSEEIARSLAHQCRLPVINILRRTRNTPTQTRFSRTQRLENLRDAFTVKPRLMAQIDNRPVILIDDVFTTGSTANECAKTLRQNGVPRVAVLTLLRG